MNEGDVPIHLFKDEAELYTDLKIEKIENAKKKAATENDVSKRMLIKLEYINDVAKRIKEMWKDKNYFPDIEHVQLAYEEYCKDFHVTPVDLS